MTANANTPLALEEKNLWLFYAGGVIGHRSKSLGVEHFGQARTAEDIHHLHGLDAKAIMQAAQALMSGRGAVYLTPLAG